MAGVAILVALACGTTESSNTAGVNLTQGNGALSYGGRIDKSSVPTASAVRVGAFKNGTLVSEVIPTQGAGTADHEFTITGLDTDVDTVSVYRVVGTTVDTSVFPPTSEDNRQILLSAPATVDATTGSNDVVISKTSYKRQINVITTYVANRIAADATKNVNDVLTELFGSVVANLDSIDVTGGNISTGTNTLVVEDDSISAAIQFMSTAVVASSVMSDSELKANASKLSTAITQLSAITAGDSLTTALSSYSELITEANSVSSSVSALISAASSFVTQVMDGNISNLTTSLTASSVSSVQTGAYKVLSFGLASGSNLAYGSASGTGGKNFSITTLAPVFELEFVSGNILTEAEAAALVSVQVSDGTTTLSSMTTISSLIDVVAADPDSSSRSNKFYLLVKKDYTSSEPALEPGTAYTYTISGNSSNAMSVSFGGATSQSGTITTTDVTLTRPYTGTEVASANLSGNATHSGVSASTDLEFRLDAKNGVVVDQTDSVGYGIVGSGSDLNFSVYKNGATTATATDTNVQANDVTFSTTESTSSISSGTLTLSSALLEAGATYKIVISDEDGMTTNGTTLITSYPTLLYIETAAQ